MLQLFQTQLKTRFICSSSILKRKPDCRSAILFALLDFYAFVELVLLIAETQTIMEKITEKHWGQKPVHEVFKRRVGLCYAFA